MKTTFMANPNTIERKWYVVDAEGKTLGRLAAEVAKVLRGKNKPTFTPHVDTGDHVIVVNAEKIRVTGKKLEQDVYKRQVLHLLHIVGGLDIAFLTGFILGAASYRMAIIFDNAVTGAAVLALSLIHI